VAFVSHSISSFVVFASLVNELQIQNSELDRLALSTTLVTNTLRTIHIISMVFVLGIFSGKMDQKFILGAFVLGLSVPEGPRLGYVLVKKL